MAYNLIITDRADELIDERVMDELKKNNFIERVGGTRGYWKVNKE